MLREDSDREKITITLKRDNKKILESLADSENRNISRQVDYLIEMFYSYAEQELLAKLSEAEERVQNGETWYTSEELRAKLGV